MRIPLELLTARLNHNQARLERSLAFDSLLLAIDTDSTEPKNPQQGIPPLVQVARDHYYQAVAKEKDLLTLRRAMEIKHGQRTTSVPQALLIKLPKS